MPSQTPKTSIDLAEITPETAVSGDELAIASGHDPDTVRKRAAKGFLDAALLPDGRYDLARGLALLATVKTRTRGSKPRTGAPSSAGPSLWDLQTEHEQVKIDERKLKLRLREGDLVEWRSFRRDMFDFARRERDAWMTWPASVAPRLAAKFALELGAVQIALEAEVRAKLRDMAKRLPLESRVELPCVYCGALPCACLVAADG